MTWISARPLIASVNDVLARGARGLVTELRRHWSPLPPPTIMVGPPDESDAGETTFFLIGDTGEQDASQYVVAPALSAATRTYRPAFVMIMSDVIYPSGDVNDYADGVYRPYRSEEPDFQVKAPVLALPGNHDWYDGLAGFMYHFVGPNKPPDEVYAPAAGQGGVVSRLCRVLWRRPSDPSAATTSLRAADHLTGPLEQPGPYYAVQTPDVLLVCIDTGIDGTIDEQQGAWLRTVSKQDGPKLLVTGKPLVVNEEIHRCAIRSDDPADDRDLGTVWDIVQDPAHRYVATVGGDVHNFQLYGRRTDEHGSVVGGGPEAHVVAGCGGAFTHATHMVSVGANDSRVRAKGRRDYYGPPSSTFPTAGDSLRLFASLLVPKIRWMIIYLCALLVGTTAAAVATLYLPEGARWPAGLAVASIAAGLVAVWVVSAVPRMRALPRSSRWARTRIILVMSMLGVLGVAVGDLLDAPHVVLYVTVGAVVLILHAVIAALVRQSGWWRPADEYPRNPGLALFTAVLLVVAAVVAAAQLALGWWTDPAVAMISAYASALLLVVVGLAGQWRRRRMLTVRRDGKLVDRRPELRQHGADGKREMTRRGRSNAAWHRAGLPTAYAVQAACLLLAVMQLLVVVGAAADSYQALGMILGTALVFVAGVLVLLVTWVALLLGATELGAALLSRRFQDHRTAWGAAARSVGRTSVPVLVVVLGVLVAAVTFLTDRIPVPVAITIRAGVAPVICLVVFVTMMLIIDTLRRLDPRRYPWWTMLVVGAVVLLGWVLSAEPAARWVVTHGAGAVVALLAVVVIAVIGHLSFLGAYWLIIDRRTLARPEFSDRQVDELFRVRARVYPPERPDPRIVPRHVLRWARLTSPGLGEPGGILQKEVSEIFSCDQPRFYKGFLRLTTTRCGDQSVLRIFLHQVFGDQHADVVQVLEIALDQNATVTRGSGRITASPAGSER